MWALIGAIPDPETLVRKADGAGRTHLAWQMAASAPGTFPGFQAFTSDEDSQDSRPGGVGPP